MASRDKLNNQSNSRNTFELVPETQTSHRRSRPLESFWDDVGLQNLAEQRNRNNRVTTVPPTQVEEEAPQDVCDIDSGSTSNSFNVDDPWEQDSLWRESLSMFASRNPSHFAAGGRLNLFYSKATPILFFVGHRYRARLLEVRDGCRVAFSRRFGERTVGISMAH